MNKFQQIKIIKDLSKAYKIRVYFYNNPDDPGGFYRKRERSSSIHINQKSRDLISIFFHELGHYYCDFTGKWTEYHKSYNSIKKSSNKKKILKKIIKTAWKAETWIDKWAEKEMSKYFNYKFTPCYNTLCNKEKKETRKWFNNYMVGFYKNWLMAVK